VESEKICRRDAEGESNTIVAIYVDEYISGKSSKKMPEFLHLLEDAKNGVNTALKPENHNGAVWKRLYARRVNRFGRNRADMVSAEIKLTELGISLKFVEDGIDTAKPFGKSVMGILSELAEQERQEIVANTARGREYAKLYGTRSGKPFGHPKKDVDIKMIREARMKPLKERYSWKKLEEIFKVSRTVMLKRLSDAGYWDKDKRCIK
jgi:DNA invertase Pin-like site-specific DNA recombinase